ncbi:MAG: hypothetical protein JWL63_3211 [Rhodocyclales bacterium]|nr:hypothetical protein [Rhodocyclales bacterium]
MQNAIPLLSLPILASGVLVANRFVSPAGATAAAAGNSYGVNRTAAAIGDRVTLDVLGTTMVESGAAIAAGALIEADATGRAVTKSAGVTLGRLAPGESASAAGQLVEVILIPN